MHYIVVHESTHCKEQLAVPQVALGVRFWRMPICRRERQRAVKLFCLRRPRQCRGDRKSTRLNSSHSQISYAVFCLKKKKTTKNEQLSLRLLNRPLAISPCPTNYALHVHAAFTPRLLHRPLTVPLRPNLPCFLHHTR